MLRKAPNILLLGYYGEQVGKAIVNTDPGLVTVGHSLPQRLENGPPDLYTRGQSWNWAQIRRGTFLALLWARMSVLGAGFNVDSRVVSRRRITSSSGLN